MNSSHLQLVNQTYCQHFKEAFSYSFLSLQASLYFFIHALYPDICEFKGSTTICNLIKKLRIKFKDNL